MNKKKRRKNTFHEQMLYFIGKLLSVPVWFFFFPISTVTGVDNIASEDVASSDNYTGEWKHELLKA